jgi:hypothetical protein
MAADAFTLIWLLSTRWHYRKRRLMLFKVVLFMSPSTIAMTPSSPSMLLAMDLEISHTQLKVLQHLVLLQHLSEGFAGVDAQAVPAYQGSAVSGIPMSRSTRRGLSATALASAMPPGLAMALLSKRIEDPLGSSWRTDAELRDRLVLGQGLGDEDSAFVREVVDGCGIELEDLHRSSFVSVFEAAKWGQILLISSAWVKVLSMR